ncbi:MAG: zinc finger domain-containing protein, partial [Nitrospiraceae bacterium]
RHLVYDRAGEPCLAKCGRTIRRLAGERSSYYCPTCQRRK